MPETNTEWESFRESVVDVYERLEELERAIPEDNREFFNGASMYIDQAIRHLDPLYTFAVEEA